MGAIHNIKMPEVIDNQQPVLSDIEPTTIFFSEPLLPSSQLNKTTFETITQEAYLLSVE